MEANNGQIKLTIHNILMNLQCKHWKYTAFTHVKVEKYYTKNKLQR